MRSFLISESKATSKFVDITSKRYELTILENDNFVFKLRIADIRYQDVPNLIRALLTVEIDTTPHLPEENLGDL